MPPPPREGDRRERYEKGTEKESQEGKAKKKTDVNRYSTKPGFGQVSSRFGKIGFDQVSLMCESPLSKHCLRAPPRKIFILIASRALNELFIATRVADRNYLKHRAPLKPDKTLTSNSKNSSHNHQAATCSGVSEEAKTIDETLLWLAQ